MTGDELTDPGEPLAPGGIYSSNGYALAAQVERAGAELATRERVRRQRRGHARRARRARSTAADVVCVSGGVSVGPHDHVKARARASSAWRSASGA